MKSDQNVKPFPDQTDGAANDGRAQGSSHGRSPLELSALAVSNGAEAGRRRGPHGGASPFTPAHSTLGRDFVLSTEMLVSVGGDCTALK